jgi:hypothetical protein
MIHGFGNFKVIHITKPDHDNVNNLPVSKFGKKYIKAMWSETYAACFPSTALLNTWRIYQELQVHTITQFSNLLLFPVPTSKNCMLNLPNKMLNFTTAALHARNILFLTEFVGQFPQKIQMSAVTAQPVKWLMTLMGRVQFPAAAGTLPFSITPGE